MPDYVECPFCVLIFEDPGENWVHQMGEKKPLDRHIEQDHHKVRVRKGSNYRWVDAKEVKRRLEQTERLIGSGKRA